MGYFKANVANEPLPSKSSSALGYEANIVLVVNIGGNATTVKSGEVTVTLLGADISSIHHDSNVHRPRRAHMPVTYGIRCGVGSRE